MFNSHAAGRLAAGFIALSCLSSAAYARDYAVGPLKIVHPWSRPTPPSAMTAVGYLTVVNTGSAPDRLVAGSTPAAGALEIHQSSDTGGVMRMRAVAGGVSIPAGGTVTFGPDGYHLMLVGPKRPFKAGDHVPVSLVFEHAGTVKLDLDVEAPGGGGVPGLAKPGMTNQ
jgi:copper(I)-binding protein